MIASTKYLWVFLIMIWVSVLSLTKLNPSIISEILSNRERIEILRMDREFWKRNSNNIKSVVDKEKSLYHEIESLKLGEVELNDNIKRLFNESGVYDLVIKMDSKTTQGDSIPINISFKGQLKRGAEVLGRIQKEFPYLYYREIGISRDNDSNGIKFDAVVIYKYKFAAKQYGR